jgi:CHRD domain
MKGPDNQRSVVQNLGLAIGFIAPMAVSFSVFATDVKDTLSGDQEVPPVTTNAKGRGTLTFGTDKSVAGSVATTGIFATAAHIHEGAPGKSGGVIIPLIKGADGRWIVPAGTKLTDAQEASLLAGNLYVNVHSDAHKDGEIRGQIKP